MDKFKYIIQIVLFGFLILKESSLNPLQNEKKCSSSSQAKNDQFSYIVLIRVHSNGEILCQGTLIDVNWVLTSAYCINTTNNIPLNNIDIAIRNNKTHTTILKPKKVIETKNNDVALLKIEKSIITNSMIKPIKLATEDLLNNTECVVISLQKQLNNDLSLIYWNVVNILKQKYDKSEWYLEDTICHSQIWNSLQNTTDNGTPLICNNQLYGIYSFNELNIFNNIIKYNNWIKNLINPTSLDTASEKYMTNFVSNHNSISDTNSTVTEFNTNNISSLEYVYKKTYSKPVSTSFVYTQKERKSITMDVEYNSLSTEPTIMKDMDIIKFVYNNSNSPEEIAEIEKTTVKKISYETEESSDTENTTETEDTTKTEEETAETEKTTETSEILSDTTESVDLTSSKSPTQSYSSTTIIKSSTTEKSDSNLSPMTYITIDTDYLEYTEKNKDNEESSDNSSSESSTIQSSTTENFTSSSNPSINITGKTDEPNATKNIEVTEITWGTSSSESSTEESESIINSDYIKETEYTKTIMYNEETDYISDISSELSTPVTPVTQDTSIKVSTLNPKPSTAKSEETIDPDDTEDPYSKMPSTHRPITQSSTTKVSTLSTSPSTVISEETEETEDDRLIETIRTTVIDGTKQTSQTETSVTYSSTITTIIPPNITTSQSSPESNTTLSDHGDEPNTTTTTTTPTTTSIRTVVIYDISDPREFSTFVDDQYQDKSSSQITSIHTSLIIIVFYIMYHTNL